jgi:hypothetical protein
MPPCPLLFAALLGAGPVASDAVAPRSPDGTYRIVANFRVNAQGRVVHDGGVASSILVLTHKSFNILNARESIELTRNLSLLRPAAFADGKIDVESNPGGRTIPALYRFQGGRLQIIFRPDFKERPQGFGDREVRIIEAVPYQLGRLAQSDPLIPTRKPSAPKEAPPGGR